MVWANHASNPVKSLAEFMVFMRILEVDTTVFEFQFVD